MKILTFAATNHKQSINKQLLQQAAGYLVDEQVEWLDINDYPLPIYSQDLEEVDGIPQAARDFLQQIAAADALLISFAEHNGGYTVAYKNLFDWASRELRKVYQDKPIVMLATSPGPGGAKNVLATAETAAPIFGGKVLATVSVPSFYDHFDVEKGQLTNPELTAQLQEAVSLLREPVVA